MYGVPTLTKYWPPRVSQTSSRALCFRLEQSSSSSSFELSDFSRVLFRKCWRRHVLFFFTPRLIGRNTDRSSNWIAVVVAVNWGADYIENITTCLHTQLLSTKLLLTIRLERISTFFGVQSNLSWETCSNSRPENARARTTTTTTTAAHFRWETY